jgi:sporulation protein YlmC with PRC-barrel domain
MTGMPNGAQITIGGDATCQDGVCGEVTRVVVDPIAQTVTHLVIEPKHRQGLGRLVPLDLVDLTTGEVELRCTIAAFEKLDHAEETDFLPGSIGYAGYGSGEVLSWPYYGANMPLPVVTDTVPVGEVAVRRGESVRATDGDIGRVQGLVVTSRDHHVSHVLLQEGHLWGRKEVAIPIGSVTTIDEHGIGLNLTKQEVHDLPSVAVEHPGE